MIMRYEKIVHETEKNKKLFHRWFKWFQLFLVHDYWIIFLGISQANKLHIMSEK